MTHLMDFFNSVGLEFSRRFSSIQQFTFCFDGHQPYNSCIESIHILLGIMLQTLDTNREFESLARSYLSEHPSIVHEWRPVESALSGGRTDLICRAQNGVEVFASLTSGQITVGSGAESNDFEDFGRGLSDAAVAREAFEQFVQLLQRGRT